MTIELIIIAVLACALIVAVHHAYAWRDTAEIHKESAESWRRLYELANAQSDRLLSVASKAVEIAQKAKEAQ